MPEFSLQLSARDEKQARFLLVACVAAGVGTSLAPQLRSQALIKGFCKSLNVADGFMKGANAIHSPSPSNLFFLILAAAKAIVKGAGKGLFVKAKSAKFKKISKGLKASEGALNVVRYSSVLNYGAADSLEHVIKGYKWTRGAFNVFDGVNGARAGGYGGVKEGMKGVDVVVKAVALSKRVHGVLREGFRVSHGYFGLLLEELEKSKKQEKQAWRRRARQGEMFLLSESM